MHVQTGRHVLRYGLQNTVVWPQDPWAMPLNETFLSENLQEAGYYTAYFGKWVRANSSIPTLCALPLIERDLRTCAQHLGFFAEQHLPMNRGFNEQYGYYLGGEDYWDHTRTGGLDWHRNDTLVSLACP
jgi:arylsulfatase A-like enzyme